MQAPPAVERGSAGSRAGKLQQDPTCDGSSPWAHWDWEGHGKRRCCSSGTMVQEGPSRLTHHLGQDSTSGPAHRWLNHHTPSSEESMPQVQCLSSVFREGCPQLLLPAYHRELAPSTGDTLPPSCSIFSLSCPTWIPGLWHPVKARNFPLSKFHTTEETSLEKSSMELKAQLSSGDVSSLQQCTAAGQEAYSETREVLSV